MEIIYSIKDKLNLVSFNAWSGTDYLKNTTNFDNSPISSREWCSNGERSLKLTRQSDDYSDYTTNYYSNLPCGTYLITFKLYAPNTNGRIAVFTNEETITIDYSPQDILQDMSITITNLEINFIRFSIWTPLESIYLDDLSIIAQ